MGTYPDELDAVGLVRQLLEGGWSADDLVLAAETLVDRALQAGYTGWLALGENIAAGQTTPEAVMAAWMASPGHRDNILGNYNDIGVGLAADATGRITWVQDFGQSQTVAVVTPPANCAPRPAFNVRSVPVSPGVLQVTVTAGRTAGAPNSVRRTIRFGSLSNATVDLPGYGSVASNTTAGLVPGTQQVTFVVRRAASLTGTTVPFTLTDDCADRRTFIGGGGTAF